MNPPFDTLHAFLQLGCFHYRINAYLLSFLVLTLKFYNSGYHGEEGIISSLADIETGVEFCASLSDEYIAGLYKLSAIPFHSETLPLTVASVP